MRRKCGKLTDEDKAVWAKVTQSTSPLRISQILQADVELAPLPPQPSRPLKTLTRKPIKTEARVTISISSSAIGKAGAEMDRKNYERLRKGKLKPDARLDMHGLTAEQAHAELNTFVHHAYASGKRLALVITGKGNPKRSDMEPARHGILRHSVPRWLEAPNLRGMILETTQAHAKHGGGGAYYVYLRRRRDL